MFDRLLSVVAPHRCSSCDEIGAIFCDSCKYDIVSEPFSQCVLCAGPCGPQGVCAHCSKQTKITQAWCAGERRDGLKNLVDSYKFQSSRAAGVACAALLQAVVPQLPQGTVLVGIPSSPRTIRARGFDHMGHVAKKFAEKRNLPVIQPLRRTSPVTLHFLPRAERVRLGPSLFRLTDAAVPETVLLLDDIVTTGTTLRAATKLLREAGAKHIYVAVLARQPEG